MSVSNVLILYMQKRLELLNSRMQELQNLGATIAPLLVVTCTSNVQVEAVADQSLSLNLKKDAEVLSQTLFASEWYTI